MNLMDPTDRNSIEINHSFWFTGVELTVLAARIVHLQALEQPQEIVRTKPSSSIMAELNARLTAYLNDHPSPSPNCRLFLGETDSAAFLIFTAKDLNKLPGSVPTKKTACRKAYKLSKNWLGQCFTQAGKFILEINFGTVKRDFSDQPLVESLLRQRGMIPDIHP